MKHTYNSTYCAWLHKSNAPNESAANRNNWMLLQEIQICISNMNY